MERRRGTHRLLDLTRGPGRLAQAMDIDKRCDGVDLCADGKLWLGDAVQRTGEIGMSIRIGITRDVHRLHRFYERGSPFVSGPETPARVNRANPTATAYVKSRGKKNNVKAICTALNTITKSLQAERGARNVWRRVTPGFTCGCVWNVATSVAAILPRTNMPPNTSTDRSIPLCNRSSLARTGAGVT